MTTIQKVNLALRATMEFGIVLALGYWGFHSGQTSAAKWLLAIGAPALGFGFWGMVDFHQAGRVSESLRLVQELLVSGLAAVALYAAGQHALGWALAINSVIYHGLVYLSGNKLLKHNVPGDQLGASPS